MIKHIKPLPISEEMLGAYLEGNLAQHNAQYVERMLQGDNELSAFVEELSVSDNLASNYLLEDLPSFENDFTLPEISTELGTYIEPHALPFGFDPSFADVAACACMPDITDDGDIIINEEMLDTAISEDLDFGVDINSEDLPNGDEL
jgi:hypothetical protein